MPNELKIPVDINFGDAISQADSLDNSFDSVLDKVEQLAKEASQIGAGGGFDDIGDKAQEAGDAIEKGIGDSVKKVNSEIEQTAKKTHGALGGITEKLGDVGGALLGGGLLIGAGAVLEKSIEGAKDAAESVEKYRISLRQAGVEEKNLAAEQAKGEAIVQSLAEKYNQEDDSLRDLLSSVTAIGGVSGEQSKRIAEIGIAFEQVGVPAKALKGILQGSADPETVAGLDALKGKFPALSAAIDNAGTAGEKIDAIFKGVQPTLEGMAEAVDSPVGKLKKLEIAGGEILESIGGAVISLAQPIISVLIPVINVIGQTIEELVDLISNAVAPIAELFDGMGESSTGFSDVLKALLDFSLLPVTTALKGIAIVIGGVVDAWQGAASVVSDIGNFFGITSDVDNANTHAAATARDVKEAYEEYSNTIQKVNDELSSAEGVASQVDELAKLQEKTELTTDEQKKLADLTSELGDKFPEATSGVNDLTGAYEVNAEKLRQLSDEQEALASDEKKKLIEENLLQPTRDLLPALDAQKEKLSELREELDNAISSGDKDKILEARDAYNKQKDVLKQNEEQLHKNVEALVEQGLVGKGSAEEIAAGMGISVEEAKKLVPVVAQINKGLEEQEAQAKKTAESIGGLAKKFDEASSAAKKQLQESASGLAQLLADQRKARQEGNTEELAAINKRIQEEIKLGKERDKQVELDDKLLDRANTLIGNVEVQKKEQEDLIALEELRQGVARKMLEVTLLELDNGTLTAQSKADILEKEREGLEAVLAVAKAEEERLAKIKNQKSVEQDVLNVRSKSLDIQARLLEIQKLQTEDAKSLRDAWLKINEGISNAEIALLKALSASDQFNDSLKLKTANEELKVAKDNLETLTAEFTKAPGTNALLEEFNKLFDASGNLVDNIDLASFSEEFAAKTKEINENLANNGVDATKLIDTKGILDAITKVVTAQTGLSKTAGDIAKSNFEKNSQFAKQLIDDQLFIIEQNTTNEIEAFNAKIAATEEFYAREKELALGNKEILEQIQKEENKALIDLNRQKYAAQKKQAEDYAATVSDVLGAGFNAAAQQANSGLFTVIDEGFGASESAVGAFASSAIKKFIELGEQWLIQQAIAAASNAVLAATMTATMATIEAAAAPAAFAVAVASFGAAPLAALASLSGNFAAFKGILALAEGSVVNSPTLTMLGEGFEAELVLPMKKADRILEEMIASKQDQLGSSRSSGSIERDLSRALQKNPVRGFATGAELQLVSSREEGYRIRRGGTN